MSKVRVALFGFALLAVGGVILLPNAGIGGSTSIEQAVQGRPTIPTRSGPWSPPRGVDPAIRERLQRPDQGAVAVVVQLTRQLRLDEHRQLREGGIRLQEYLGNNAYVASIARGIKLDTGRLAQLIQVAAPLRPKDKVAFDLTRPSVEPWAVDSATGRLFLLVTFFDDVGGDVIRRALASLGFDARRYGASNTWAVAADRASVGRIAELEIVKSVQFGPMPFLPLFNDGGRRLANTDQAQLGVFTNPQPSYQNVSGNGIDIGICDVGIDENHNDFSVIDAAGQVAGSRVYHVRTGSGSHGTHVASIAGGNGFNSAANGWPAYSLRGHAPRARLGDYPQFGSQAQSFYDAIVTDGTDLTNHSYVQSFTVYDAEAQSLDLIVRGDGTDNAGNLIPARPQVWAAGNNGFTAQYGDEEGYYSVFTSAKNTISVGSLDTRDGRLSRFSSLGPTFDGRIKPDVVAPGCFDGLTGTGIQAASSNTQGYTGKCGTSMAAPVVSGILALMMEQFQNNGGAIGTLLPSTYKAILIHTARDRVKTEAHEEREFDNPDTHAPVLYHAGPDFATGYGLVDAEAARLKIGATAFWREAALNATGAKHTYCIDVAQGSDQVKVVIAWDDEAGSTLTSETTAKVVNDLDLTLTAPSGAVYQPWTLTPLPLTATPGDGAADPITTADVKPAVRGADHRNNVEMVSVPLPQAGTWRVTVTAHSLPTGNAQPYSLVTSHRFLFCYPPGPFKICDLFPWLCRPLNVCQRYPWLCHPEYIKDPVFDRGSWVIDPREPLPIDQICKYVVNCPGCGGPGWAYCPGWDVMMDQLPADAIVTVFDDRGRVVARDSSHAASRTIRVERREPGTRYFAMFTNRGGVPYPRELRLRFDLKALPPIRGPDNPRD